MSGSPENADSSEIVGTFPTRRQLREQRAAAEAAGASGAEAPGADAPASDPSDPAAKTADQVADGGDETAGNASSIVPALSVVSVGSGPAVPLKPADVTIPDVATRVGGFPGRRHSTIPLAMVTTATTSRRPGGKRRSPLRIAATLVAIPGLLMTVALPAYALAPNGEIAGGASAAHILTTAGAQDLDVASSAAQVTVARDGFSATTEEELTERAVEAERAAAAERAAEAAASSPGTWSVRGPRAEGDDYPWPYEATDNQGGGLSPLGYYYRECVDFVAWRLNRDAGASAGNWIWTWHNMTPNGGNASAWASAWESHGWATSNEPVVGAVAWFSGNHVAYVQSVPGDGTVVLEEYNWGNDHAYHTRTVPNGEVALFLYPPA